MNKVEIENLVAKSGQLQVNSESSCSGSETSDSADDYDDIDEDDSDIMKRQVKGLFTEKIFDNVKELFKFEAEMNDFNLIDVLTTYNMDMIAYIKMINYIRTEVIFKTIFQKLCLRWFKILLILRNQKLKCSKPNTKMRAKCRGAMRFI